MTLLVVLGPWAAILYKIFYISAILGPNRRPTRPEKYLFQEKSIGRSQPAYVSQVKPDLTISLGSLGPWAAILYEICYISALLGPSWRPNRPEKYLFEKKSTGRSSNASVSQVKPDLMISLVSFGPWDAILYKICYISALLGPNWRPKRPEKCIFAGKSIGMSKPTPFLQVKPDLMIYLGFLGPWAAIFDEIAQFLSFLGWKWGLKAQKGKIMNGYRHWGHQKYEELH